MTPESSTTATLTGLLERTGLGTIFGLSGDEDERPCDCRTEWDSDVLTMYAADCEGDIASSPNCRRTVIRELWGNDASEIRVRRDALEYRYGERGVGLLSAAGQFAELLADRDERLLQIAERDPLSAAEELRTRADPATELAHQSGLLDRSAGVEGYDDVLSPSVGLILGNYFLDRSVPDRATLVDTRSLPSKGQARVYDRADSVPLYVLDPVDVRIDPPERRLLLDAYETIADGAVGGELAAASALQRVSGEEAVDPTLVAVLEKHTKGYGVFEDLFADPAVTDVYVTSSVDANPLRIVLDGETMATNVSLTESGAGAIASRIRRTSGRSFSRANPTVDATAELRDGTSVRVAGVTEPVADGVGFAFRQQAADSFTLPELVANGTMPPAIAGFLSVAVERDAAVLVAGSRGAGKTTLLGTLLYELTPDTRTVVIEDTPELPVTALQSVDRDVQALRTGKEEGPEVTSAEALRTALRLGDGALVVGEIRGDEADVLYEAMRVGANANAVLGTIHGDGASDVYERVVTDLGVAPSSFGATDLVVTVRTIETDSGRTRRVSAVEEVVVDGDDVHFEALYELEGDEAVATGRIDRGNSHLVGRLAGAGAQYADVRSEIQSRADEVGDLAADGLTRPDEVAAAYAVRGVE